MTEKNCSKCKAKKLLTEFHKKSNLTKHPDGFYSQCRQCVSAYMKAKYENNPERDKEKSRIYRQSNPDKARACVIAWRKNNREAHLDMKRRSGIKNRESSRERRMQRCYGISILEYDKICESQSNSCAICKSTKSLLRKGSQHWNVDHDHKTGKVRGLLCYLCNSALGHFQDDSERIRKAIEYLKHHQSSGCESNAEGWCG
jgi:hypothetical protein